MKKIYTFIVIASSTLWMNAQEINESNIPIIGDHSVIAICGGDALDPGSAGANQTWDMSGLTETVEQSFDYVDPDETLWAGQMPDANLCGVSWDGSHSYYKVSSSALEVVGYRLIAAGDTVKMDFTNLEQIVELPYSNGTAFNDTFEGTSQAMGFDIAFDGTLDFEADGFGTLILPTGTYSNVVRYYFDRVQNNAGSPFAQTKEQWAWVSSDYRFWLLLMESSFDGINNSNLIWYDKNPYPVTSSVNELSNDNSIQLLNSALGSSDDLIINSQESVYSTVKVYDLSGKLLMTENLQFQNGKNSISKGSANLTSGIYILKIESENGIFSTRFMVQK